jgi:ATP-binding cassette subfamily B protein
MIAHRLSTIRSADKIVVISGGAVSEAGTHSELMALDRIYAALYRTQFETQPT